VTVPGLFGSFSFRDLNKLKRDSWIHCLDSGSRINFRTTFPDSYFCKRVQERDFKFCFTWYPTDIILCLWSGFISPRIRTFVEKRLHGLFSKKKDSKSGGVPPFLITVIKGYCHKRSEYRTCVLTFHLYLVRRSCRGKTRPTVRSVMYMYVSKRTIKNTSMDTTGSWGLDCEINLRSWCFIRLIWQDDLTLSLWHAVRGIVVCNFSPRNLTRATSTMKPGQECMVWFSFGKENNSSRRVILKIELELNKINSILSRSAVTPVQTSAACCVHGCVFDCVFTYIHVHHTPSDRVWDFRILNWWLTYLLMVYLQESNPILQPICRYKEVVIDSMHVTTKIKFTRKIINWTYWIRTWMMLRNPIGLLNRHWFDSDVSIWDVGIERLR